MVVLTKKREGMGWRVHADGRPTAIFIDKGPPPKFGAPQTWDVTDEHGQRYLFEAKSLGRAMEVLGRIQTLLPAQASS